MSSAVTTGLAVVELKLLLYSPPHIYFVNNYQERNNPFSGVYVVFNQSKSGAPALPPDGIKNLQPGFSKTCVTQTRAQKKQKTRLF